MGKFRIISFDGGGIRGVLSATILRRICERFPRLLYSTQLFAGTSTGSLIALALAFGKDENDVYNLYNKSNSKRIFTKSYLGFIRPKYNNKNFKKVLLETFPRDLKIKDLKKYVVIPAFNVKGYDSENWGVVFFNNLTLNSTNNVFVIDAALASSAAPTYFPSHKDFIDGGVCNNSPTTSSLFMTLDKLKDIYKLEDFRLLSIGTGLNPNSITRNTSKWGISQWAFNPLIKQNTPLLSIVGDGMIEIEDIHCKQILGDYYFKVNPILNKMINIDDFNAVDYLREVGEKFDLTEVFNFIENYFLK